MDNIIMAKDRDKAQAKVKRLKSARNKACAVIEDAKARYIKSKTRAKSKKAAVEKDAVLNSDRFKVLEIYDRFEDIQECYGLEMITEAERDRLEALWEERENIKNQTEDGIYKDLVTEALDMACNYILEIWHDEIYDAEQLKKKFDKQVKQAEEEYKALVEKENETYKKLMGA